MGGKKKNSEGRTTLEEAMADLASRFVVNCPSEEQESINRCMWQVEAAHWFYDDVYRKHHRDLPFMNFKDFTMAFFKECPAMMDQTDEAIARSLNLFQKYKRRVPVCGAIMLNTEMTKCVLVKAWGRCSAWGFPKGKINQEESKLECGVREVEEETGYNCGEHVDPHDYIELSIRQQSIRLYIATNVPENINFETQTRKEIGDIQWIPLAGLKNGSVDMPGKKQKNVDDSFFTGGPFLQPLTEWIEDHTDGRSTPKSSTKTKNRTVHANTLTQSSESESRSSSDTDSSAKKSRKKKKQPKPLETKVHQGGAQTFGSASKGGWSVEDMFAVNEAKFGIVNSYDESLYTTKLPEDYIRQKEAANSKSRKSRRPSDSLRNEPARSVQIATPPPANAIIYSSATPPANAFVYSVDTPYNQSCTNFFLPPSTPARCSDVSASFKPNLSSTPLPVAPTLLEFSFNRDEILSCF
jgi:8-oxo-dGTP pyrophosphatase MutT (NUDIX family)